MDEFWGIFIGGIVIGFFLATIFFIVFEGDSLEIDQATGNDICVQLTGNESAIAEDTWGDGIQGNEGKLICITPSFDATQNIIIKSNQDE